MSKIKRSLIFVGGIIVFLLTIKVASSQANTTLAAEVQANFAKMSELSMEQAMSSNPYDYIDNEYYDNIVELGVPAAEVIAQNYHDGEYAGLNAYIAALAIQEITDMNMYECTGEDWETGEQFFERWATTVESLPDIFEKVMDSDDTMPNKVNQIEKYGIFGRYYLTSLKNQEANFKDGYLTAKMQGFTELTSKEMDEVERYLGTISK